MNLTSTINQFILEPCFVRNLTHEMNKLIYILLIAGMGSLFLTTNAQIVVANNSNGNSLAQTLAGNGVTISNVVLNCPNGGAGTFNATNSNIGMPTGILLTSGLADTVHGPNDQSGCGHDHMAPGDPDLDGISSSSTHDACVLEFDMQVLSDSVEFRYAFASEEYLEFVNGGYNDVFGFFISGPGISGSQNIALIPGTTTPVSIDNLNDLSYPQYYIDNGDGFSGPQLTDPTVVQYDGFTTVLTAKKKGLQACQTYHLKLAVSDAGDGVLDSGVFLEANSLTSNFVSLDTVQTDVPNVSNAVEGCVRGKIRFLLETPVGFPSKVKFTIAGTATNGVDYQHIADSIIIAAGDTVATLDIIAINDGLTEGSETVKIYLLTACNNTPYDSVTLLILDTFAITVSPDVTICAGDQVQLIATGGNNYAWSPATGLNFTNIFNPVASPTASTTYICSTNVGACSSTDSVRVTVGAATFSVNAGPDIGVCNSTTAQLNAIVNGTPIPGNPFVYSWTPGGTLSNPAILNPVATPSGNSQQYVIEVSSGNCSASDTVNVTIGGMSLTVSTINESCFGYSNGSVSVSVTGGAAPIVYSWNNGGTTSSITGLQGGNYSVTVNDNAGCSASVATNVVGISAPFSVNAGPDIIECVNSSVMLNAVVTGPPVNSNPFIYQWLPSTNLSPVNSPTPTASPSAPTDYVVGVLSGACIAYDTVRVVISKVTISTSTTNETCYGYADGSANVTVSSGTAPLQYAWSNTQNTPAISSLIGGTYTVTVTDNAGCSASADATVLSTTPIFFSNPTVTNPKCFGGTDGSITITATGGANGITYLWSTGETTTTIQNLSATAPYTITATDVNQCSADTAVSLTEPTKVTVTVIGNDVKCFDGADGSAIATAAGGTPSYAYIWQNGIASATSSNMAAGNYRITVTDVNSCSAEGDITINQPLEISITAQSLAPTCPDSPTGTINANATGGTTPYMFDLIYNNSLVGSNAAGDFDNLNGGDYIIHLTDANLCEHSANLSLLTPNPDEFILTTDSTSCYGSSYSDGAVHITAVSVFNQPYQYSIDGGAPQFGGDFYNTTAGTHIITTTNNSGCVTEQSIVVPEPAEGIITITPGDSTIQLGSDIQLGTSFAPYTSSAIVSYNWSAAQGLSCTDCANPVATPYDNNSEYTLAVVYNKGCVAVSSVKVSVEGHPPVFTPNAFSPNGDGNNDVFLVYGEAIKKVELKIFNRWGELIFESNNQFSGWDGTYKGELQNPGVYTFIAAVTYLDGKKTDKNGSLTLVR